MHHPRRRNVTACMVGLRNGHIRKKNLTQNGEPQRYSRIRRSRRKRSHTQKNLTQNGEPQRYRRRRRRKQRRRKRDRRKRRRRRRKQRRCGGGNDRRSRDTQTACLAGRREIHHTSSNGKQIRSHGLFYFLCLHLVWSVSHCSCFLLSRPEGVGEGVGSRGRHG